MGLGHLWRPPNFCHANKFAGEDLFPTFFLICREFKPHTKPCQLKRPVLRRVVLVGGPSCMLLQPNLVNLFENRDVITSKLVLD